MLDNLVYDQIFFNFNKKKRKSLRKKIIYILFTKIIIKIFNYDTLYFYYFFI